MKKEQNLNQTENKRYRLVEHLLFPKTFLNESNLKERLKGKTILITGASFGIGASLSKLLGNTEAKLILVGRTEEKLVTLQDQIVKKGGTAEIFVADLRNETKIQSLIAFLKAQNRLDIFINNAGKSIKRPLTESLDRYHDFSRTMAINYEAPVKLMLALLPKLKENKGQVINISAINVLLAPAPNWAAYQASKSAFDQWFLCAVPEMENMGIATTSIYLPLVRTRMIAPTKAYDKMPAMHPDHVAKIIGKSILRKRRIHKPWWCFPAEVGSVIFNKFWMRIAKQRVQKEEIK